MRLRAMIRQQLDPLPVQFLKSQSPLKLLKAMTLLLMLLHVRLCQSGHPQFGSEKGALKLNSPMSRLSSKESHKEKLNV